METTSTLADTLLDDLADLSDADESGLKEEDQEDAVKDARLNSKLDPSQRNIQAEGEGGEGGETGTQAEAVSNKDHIALLENRFLDNTDLQKHLTRIRNVNVTSKEESKRADTDDDQSNKTEHDDYGLIVESNRHRNLLSDELIRTHGSLCRVYGRKFPELEDLLSSPVQYKAAVQVIQNEMDLSRVNDRLNHHFNSNQIITMSVASSTTEGQPLTPGDLALALQLASYIDDLDAAQVELTHFVEQRIRGLAPSLCALIGPQVAAQIVGLAGGLAELALIPACNLQVMGQIKQTAASRAGMSTRHATVAATSTTTSPNHSQPIYHQQHAHEGVLMQSDLFLSSATAGIALQHRTKLLKQVAAKVALCARCDAVNVEQGRPRTASPGEKYRREILDKLSKWQHPQDAPIQKALPKPDLAVKKRRGGKRMRRLKERFEETALMKQANTRSFSAAAGEYGDDAMGFTLGLLDTEGGGVDGSVRKNATGEKRPMRLANTKAARKQRALAARVSQQHQQQQQQQSATSGLASTVTFTPLQAMELVNPDAQRERMVRQANQKWFADNAGFQSAIGPKKK